MTHLSHELVALYALVVHQVKKLWIAVVIGHDSFYGRHTNSQGISRSFCNRLKWLKIIPIKILLDRNDKFFLFLVLMVFHDLKTYSTLESI